MSEPRVEAAYLIGESEYLHMKETQDGYSYSAFQKGIAGSITGEISREAIAESTIKNPMAAARTLAMEELGLDGMPAAEVSLNMLSKCKGSELRRRHIWEPETMPRDDIRFIDVNYNELFRIPNGGTITVEYPDREWSGKCKYIDDYHTLVNGSGYHICQFAEVLLRGGGSCRPEAEIMDDRAAWRLGGTHHMIVENGDKGYSFAVYDQHFKQVDSGVLTDQSLSMLQAREKVLERSNLQYRSRSRVDVDALKEQVAEVSGRTSVLGKLSVLKDNLPEATRSQKKGKEVSL